MKKNFLLLTALWTCSITIAHGQGTVIDPTLIALETYGFSTEKSELKKHTKAQEGIAAAEGVIYGAMDKVHDVEKTTLTYLRTASSVLQNCYQVKKIISLLDDCKDDVAELAKLIGQNKTKGVLLAGLSEASDKRVSECVDDIKVFLTPVILGSDSSLLNTAERTYMLNTLIHKLSMLRANLHIMQYRVKYLNWFDVIRFIDPDTYWNAREMQRIATSIIKEF